MENVRDSLLLRDQAEVQAVVYPPENQAFLQPEESTGNRLNFRKFLKYFLSAFAIAFVLVSTAVIISRRRENHLQESSDVKLNENSGIEILLTGGFYGSKGRQEMEIFCPENPEKSRMLDAKLLKSRWNHMSTKMGDGRVLITGGVEESPAWTTELFDPQTQHILPGPPPPPQRLLYKASMTTLANKIYLCGGGPYLRSCLVLKNGNWSAISSMNIGRENPALVGVGQKLFAIGGEGEGNYNKGKLLDSVESYNIAQDSWEMKQPMGIAREKPSAAVIGPTIFVCGGETKEDFWGSSACEKYDVDGDGWENVSNMTVGRKHFGLIVAGERLFALGGSRREAEKSVERYDPMRDEWTLLDATLQMPRYEASAVLL